MAVVKALMSEQCSLSIYDPSYFPQLNSSVVCRRCSNMQYDLDQGSPVLQSWHLDSECIWVFQPLKHWDGQGSAVQDFSPEIALGSGQARGQADFR